MVERSEIGEHADRDLAVLVQWERLDQRDRPLRGTAIFHFGNHAGGGGNLLENATLIVTEGRNLILSPAIELFLWATARSGAWSVASFGLVVFGGSHLKVTRTGDMSESLQARSVRAGLFQMDERTAELEAAVCARTR
jgi:hypothetical protein